MYIPPSRETECLVRSLIAAKTLGTYLLGGRTATGAFLACHAHARRNLQITCAADYFRPNMIGLEYKYLDPNVNVMRSMEWNDTTMLSLPRHLVWIAKT